MENPSTVYISITKKVMQIMRPEQLSAFTALGMCMCDNTHAVNRINFVFEMQVRCSVMTKIEEIIDN